jgi:hypothetical protein
VTIARTLPADALTAVAGWIDTVGIMRSSTTAGSNCAALD